MAGKDVNVVIRAINKVTGPLRKMGASVQQFSAKSKAHFKAASLAGQNFGSSMKKIGGGFMALGAGIAVGVAALDKFTGMGDNAAKTADKLGVGVEALQEWRYAAQRSGMATQDLDKSLEYLVRSAGETAAGTGAAKDVFKALGIDVKDANGKLKGGGQLMEEVADKLAKIENPTARATIAYKLFGRSGMGMVNMLKDGSAGLKQYAKEAHETGAVIGESTARQSEKFQDLFLDLKRLATGVGVTILSQLLPGINKVTEYILTWIKANRGLIATKITYFLKVAANVAIGFFKGLKSIYNAMSAVWEVVKTFIPGLDKLTGNMDTWQTVGKVLAGVLGGRLIFALISAAKAVWAFSAALWANPVAWVIAGVLALATAVYLIYDNWEPIAGFFKDLWEGIKAAWDGVAAWFKDLWDRVLAVFDMGGGLVAWFKGLWDRVLAAFDSGGFVAAGLELLVGLLEGLASGTVRVLAWAFDLPRRILKALLPEDWYNAGSQMLDKLLGGLVSGAGKVLAWAGSLMKLVLKALLPTSWYEAGSKLVGSLMDGLRNAVKGIGGSILSSVKSMLGFGDDAQSGGSASAPRAVAPAPVAVPAYHAPYGTAGQGGKMDGKIVVQFEGAPPGTRLAQVSADTDTNVNVEAGVTTSYNWLAP